MSAYQRWSQQELYFLWKAYASGAKYAHIAQVLDKTVRSIHGVLGVSSIRKHCKETRKQIQKEDRPQNVTQLRKMLKELPRAESINLDQPWAEERAKFRGRLAGGATPQEADVYEDALCITWEEAIHSIEDYGYKAKILRLPHMPGNVMINLSKEGEKPQNYSASQFVVFLNKLRTKEGYYPYCVLGVTSE